MTGAVERELAEDQRMLDAASAGASASFRTWTTAQPTVVVGKAVVVEHEVNVELCRAHGIEIVRRQSGGRSVWIGPGTLQYAFALPYALSSELNAITTSKRFCNRMLLAALEVAAQVNEDASGDLVVDTRKVGGLALRRVRNAMLLHGTLLTGADLALIDRVLLHPGREPAYRHGRPHRDFLANLPPLDGATIERQVRVSIARLAETAKL